MIEADTEKLTDPLVTEIDGIEEVDEGIPSAVEGAMFHE